MPLWAERVQHCSALYVQHSKKKKKKTQFDDCTLGHKNEAFSPMRIYLGPSYKYIPFRIRYNVGIVISERFIVGFPCSCKAFISIIYQTYKGK